MVSHTCVHTVDTWSKLNPLSLFPTPFVPRYPPKLLHAYLRTILALLPKDDQVGSLDTGTAGEAPCAEHSWQALSAVGRRDSPTAPTCHCDDTTETPNAVRVLAAAAFLKSANMAQLVPVLVPVAPAIFAGFHSHGASRGCFNSERTSSRVSPMIPTALNHTNGVR